MISKVKIGLTLLALSSYYIHNKQEGHTINKNNRSKNNDSKKLQDGFYKSTSDLTKLDNSYETYSFEVKNNGELIEVGNDFNNFYYKFDKDNKIYRYVSYIDADFKGDIYENFIDVISVNGNLIALDIGNQYTDFPLYIVHRLY